MAAAHLENAARLVRLAKETLQAEASDLSDSLDTIEEALRRTATRLQGAEEPVDRAFSYATQVPSVQDVPLLLRVPSSASDLRFHLDKARRSSPPTIVLPALDRPVVDPEVLFPPLPPLGPEVLDAILAASPKGKP
jgi:hypothetical protein